MAWFGESDTTSDSWKVWEETAHSPAGEKFQFIHTTDKACAEEYKASNTPVIILFRKFDSSPVVFTGRIETSALTTFITAESVPTLINFSDDFIKPVMGSKKASIMLFRSAEQKDTAWYKNFAQAAKDLKGQILFVESGVTEGVQKKIAEFMGVTQKDLPTLRILNSANMHKFIWSGKFEDLTVEQIAKFLDEYKSGAIKPFLKTEELPAEQGDVTQLVGKNWKELVIDSDDDLLVKFYAPWCGHCKKLAPVWEELGKDLKDVKGLRIAKMDATANEVEGVNIKGYPALKFYPKGSKGTPIEYDGKRTAEDFKKWLAEKSVNYKAHNLSKTEL